MSISDARPSFNPSFGTVMKCRVSSCRCDRIAIVISPQEVLVLMDDPAKCYFSPDLYAWEPLG